MILYQYRCIEHGVFEEAREIEDRHTCKCSKCERICPKLMSISTGNAIWQPRVMTEIAPYPIFVESRKHLAEICNKQGNYSDFAFTKNSSKIKSKNEKFVLDKKKKKEIMRGSLYER